MNILSAHRRGEGYFTWQLGIMSTQQEKRLSGGGLLRHSIGEQNVWEPIIPFHTRSYHLRQHVGQGPVESFNESVGLWVVCTRINLLDSHHRTDFQHQSRQEGGSPVREELARDAMSTDQLVALQLLVQTGPWWHIYVLRAIWSNSQQTQLHIGCHD